MTVLGDAIHAMLPGSGANTAQQDASQLSHALLADDLIPAMGVYEEQLRRDGFRSASHLIVYQIHRTRPLSAVDLIHFCFVSHLPVERLAQLPPTFTTGDADHIGLWRRDLYRLRDAGEIYELSRGVYRKSDAPETAYLDLLAVAHRAPRAVVCLVSALAVHELTDEIPSTIQIAVPRGTYRPRIAYPATEVFEFDVDTFPLGRGELEVAPGERVSLFSPARSVVDVMRFRNRVGEALALRSLRRYLEGRGSRPAELLETARALDVEGPVRQAVQAVSS